MSHPRPSGREILAQLRRLSVGKHGDGDLRLVAQHLADIGDDADPADLPGLAASTLENIEGVCRLFRGWLAGHYALSADGGRVAG
jgi:hypothetical protein